VTAASVVDNPTSRRRKPREQAGANASGVSFADRFAASFRSFFPDILGQRVVVALSGGADSLALLELLVTTTSELGCTPIAVHVHHHVRGNEADDDALFCRALCERLGVELHLEHLTETTRRGWSPEAWWRSERYRVLGERQLQLGCAALATAHTLDDQAETVLLKLLRGAGPRGVAGIRRRQGTIIRPLLDLRREAVRDWLHARGEIWREDSSNRDTSYPRAWVRLDVLPLLAARFPAAPEHLARFAEALRVDEDYLGDCLRATAHWPMVSQPVALAPIAALASALRRRWLFELAARLPLAEPPSHKQLELVEALLRGGEPSAVDLGRRWMLRRRGEALHLCPPVRARFAEMELTVPSETTLPGGLLLRLGAAQARGTRFEAWLDARLTRARVSCRPARVGERFGGHGRRITAALARVGVPPEWRRAWPMLCADDTIVWLPGVGVAQGWEVQTGDGVLAELEES
jgi:tRNA(Ile)-lysidine synthase